MERRPPALRRIRTVVDADNQASLALLAASGPVSSSVTHRGVVDVTVDLPAA
jgi:RimJ/RimL family protein N-acetyltransferase